MYKAIQKHERIVLGFVVLLLLGLAAGYAAYRPLWLDEYYTYYTADRNSLHAVWDMLTLHPLLADPPLYLWLTHYSIQLLGPTNLALRLTSVLAYGIACLCLYKIVRRRSDSVTALSAVFLTVPTIVLSYAYEGRPYELVVASSAGALLFWLILAERTDARGRRLAALGLFFSLAVAVSSHWYGCLTALPVICGEAVRTWKARKADWLVLASTVAGCAVALLYVPLIIPAWSYRSHPWKGVTLLDIRDSYKFVFDANPLLLAGSAFLLVVTASSIAFRSRNSAELETPKPLPLYESVALLTCTLLPFFGYLLGRVVVHQFLPRYIIASVVGFIVLTATGIRRVLRDKVTLTLAVLSAALTACSASAIDLYHLWQEEAHAPAVASASLLTRDPYLPIVADDQTMFFRITRTAPQDVRSRMTLLTGPAAYRILRQDTITRAAIGIQSWTRLPVADYAAFVAQNSQFLLISDLQGNMEWVGQQLQRENAKLQLEGMFAGHPLYLVTMPDRQARLVH